MAAIDASTASVFGQKNEHSGEDERGDAADDQADRGKIARGALQRLAAVPDPGRNGQPREEADRAEVFSRRALIFLFPGYSPVALETSRRRQQGNDQTVTSVTV